MSKESFPKLTQGEGALLHLLEHHGVAIEDAVLRTLSISQQRWARPLLKEWIDIVIGRFRGQGDRSMDWGARLAEAFQHHNEHLAKTLDFLMKLRDGLLTVGVSRAQGLSGEWLYEEVLRITDPHFHQLVEHCSQAERDLVSAERRRRRMMIEALETPFAAMDNDEKLMLWNSALSRVLGQSPEKLEGAAFSSFCGEEVAQELRKILRQRRANTVRTFVGGLHVGGKGLRPAAFRVQPFFDGRGQREGIAITMDVKADGPDGGTPFMAQTLNEMLRFIPLGLQVFDASRKVVFHSGTCGGLLDEAEMGARPLCCRLLPKNPETGACRCQAVFSEGAAVETEGPLSQAERVSWMRFVLVPLRDRLGQITHVSCVTMDVSQRRGLEHQILEQQRTSSVAQVAQSVAHEIRNPLGVMIGFAEMLSKGLPPERIPRAVEKILNNGLRCKEIVEELLEFGQSFPGDRIVTPLRDLIAEHVQPMFSAAQKGRIHWELPPPTVQVECMPHQLAQVFVSLIDNALIYGQTVRVSAESEGACVVIRVDDDGPGVPEEFHERIFEPFFTTRKESGGVGLGLSLSRSVVTEYGGRLILDEGKRPGASFVIELPQQVDMPAGGTVADADGPVTPAATRILIVDDEQDLVDMLETVLHMSGFEVDTAGTAAAAIDLLMARDYDAAVLDVQLPGDLSGRQLHEYILANKPELAEHTMFITADTMNFETRQFLEQSRRPYLEKPFLVTGFADKVGELIGAED